MTDEKKPASVSRGELFSYLGPICLLISFALLGIARHAQNALEFTGDYILFGVALALSVTFLIWGMVLRKREQKRRPTESSGLVEPDTSADRRRD